MNRRIAGGGVGGDRDGDQEINRGCVGREGAGAQGGWGGDDGGSGVADLAEGEAGGCGEFDEMGGDVGVLGVGGLDVVAGIDANFDGDLRGLAGGEGVVVDFGADVDGIGGRAGTAEAEEALGVGDEGGGEESEEEGECGSGCRVHGRVPTEARLKSGVHASA